jgi:hypothetical protein
MSAAEKLRALKAQHRLTNAGVAELAGVAVKTVEGWLAHDHATSRREMPERHLALIEARLASAQAPRTDAGKAPAGRDPSTNARKLGQHDAATKRGGAPAPARDGKAARRIRHR